MLPSFLASKCMQQTLLINQRSDHISGRKEANTAHACLATLIVLDFHDGGIGPSFIGNKGESRNHFPQSPSNWEGKNNS